MPAAARYWNKRFSRSGMRGGKRGGTTHVVGRQQLEEVHGPLEEVDDFFLRRVIRVAGRVERAVARAVLAPLVLPGEDFCQFLCASRERGKDAYQKD